jgi:hypothetical protein
MTTDFEALVADFETLVEKSTDLSGKDLKENRREQVKVEKLIASITETGMLKYNDTYADCRDIGHQWEEKFTNWEANVFTRMCHCIRCGSERYDNYSRTGALMARKYDYSEGYLLSDDEIRAVGGRVRRYWRTVNIHRSINGSV